MSNFNVRSFVVADAKSFEASVASPTVLVEDESQDLTASLQSTPLVGARPLRSFPRSTTDLVGRERRRTVERAS